MEQVKAEPVELKPCPLCGGEARCSENWPTWDTREWAAYCYDDCGCVVSKRTVAEAIAAWNQRANPQPAAVDGLVKALEFYADELRYEFDQTCCWDTRGLSKKRIAGLVKSGGDVIGDNGERARQALAQIERTEDGNG